MSTVNVRPLMYFAHLLTVMKKAEIFHSRNQKLQKPCIGLFFFLVIQLFGYLNIYTLGQVQTRFCLTSLLLR